VPGFVKEGRRGCEGLRRLRYRPILSKWSASNTKEREKGARRDTPTMSSFDPVLGPFGIEGELLHRGQADIQSLISLASYKRRTAEKESSPRCQI